MQYPDEAGRLDDLKPFIDKAHAANVKVAVATDLLALALATSPGEAGADVVFGNSQRFGVPLGFGGPHAGVLRHQPGIRAAHAGPRHRRVDRRARPSRLSHVAADARAAHPPREGDLEHLHRAGAARQHGGDVRRVSRPRRHQGDRDARARHDARARRRAEALGYRAAATRSYFDTLRITADARRA